MEEGLITKLVEFVETASPIVWAAARQQVVVSVFQHTLWAIVLLVTAGVLARVCFLANKKAAEDDYGYGTDVWIALIIVCVLVGLFALFVAIACVSIVMGAIINPDYYAIKCLLDLFTTN